MIKLSHSQGFVIIIAEIVIFACLFYYMYKNDLENLKKDKHAKYSDKSLVEEVTTLEKIGIALKCILASIIGCLLITLILSPIIAMIYISFFDKNK